MSIVHSLISRSLENPSTSLADPDEWLYDALGGGQTDVGLRVNASTALTYAAVWRAVNLVARDIAKLPCVLYKRVGIGKDRDPAHPAYRLLKHKPNAEMNAFYWKLYIMFWALIRGNGYAYIVRAGNGAPQQLIPLSAATTRPVRVDGRLLYKTRVGTQERSLLPENVFHLRGLSEDGVEGISLITKARESIGLGMALHKYGRMLFANGVRPSGAIEHPNRLSPEAHKHLKTSIEKEQTGLDKVHRLLLLEEGMKFNAFSFSNEDAQFLETRKHEIREIANWFNVPPHKLGDDSRTAYNSLEQENQSYLDEAIDPWLVAFEMEAWDKLLTGPQQQRDSHVIEFTRHALVRANLQTRAIYYDRAIKGGWMSPDEVRGRENANPIRDGLGDVYFRPLNTTVAGSPHDPNVAAPGAGQAALRTTHEALVVNVLERMFKRIRVHADKARRQNRLADWVLTEARADHQAVVAAALAPVVAAARAAGLHIPKTAQVTERFFAYCAEACANGGITDASAAELAAALFEEPPDA